MTAPPKAISVLGSTGSIGTQTLEVARHLGLSVVALAARRNVHLMEEQARVFAPQLAAMEEESAAAELRNRLRDTSVKVLSGMDGLCEAAAEQADIAVSALVGIAGLRPTLAALREGIPVALANKETLVCGGDLVMALSREKKVPVLPVDSEHSAIFPCLSGQEPSSVDRIVLTASGGPFRGWTAEQLAAVTPAQALKHPNWSMGAKVTIDSATLMNKGLELIEAMHLFDMPEQRIDVLVHPQSIIHSMVVYKDGSTMAQLGLPDMRLPIQFALTYPARSCSPTRPVNLAETGTLTFEQPDEQTFSCLALARSAARRGGTAPTVLNAASEVAVERFLAGQIGFLDIPEMVGRTLELVPVREAVTLEDIFRADALAREAAKEF